MSRIGRKKCIKIVISTIFQDAGDATRAIEIAGGLARYAPPNIDYRIIFFSHGSRFEQNVLDRGFEIYHVAPLVEGIGERHDYKMTPNNFIGDRHLAKELIEGEIVAYNDVQPDVVLFGFWPMAGLAYRMMPWQIVGICYLPLPLTNEYLDYIPDIPEQVPVFSALPAQIRKVLLKLPLFIKRRIPPLRQPNILWAAAKVGWRGERLVNLFDFFKADLTVVNDLPDYYVRGKLPKSVVFSGPVFCRSENDEPVEPEIRNIFSVSSSRWRIFCTLGSSGTKEQLLEIVKIFTFGEGRSWSGVILSPMAVCPIEEARRVLGESQNVYVTDKFVPAEKVNSMADVVICHGGQGTLQTALHSGTPLVGVAAQAEQFLNLHNVVSQGAGIRIPMADWSARNIQAAVHRIMADENFKHAAMRLKERMESFDGIKTSANVIWSKITETCVRLEEPIVKGADADC